MLYGHIREELGVVFHRLAKQKESLIEEGHLMVDHVHIMISIPPKYAVSQVVGFLKGKSAIHIARVHAGRRRNFVEDAGRSLTWSAFGKALTITRGSTTLTLRYGPGNRRIRKRLTGPLSETVTYLGSAERLDINGRVSIRRTLGIAGIAIIDTGGAQSKRLYPIADHLGSTIAIADSSGHLVQGLAYADFGKRYSAGWGATLTTAQALSVNTTLSDRGYTGQESLDAIGLDDYNARLYDPGLGRFLSVDPLIGHPGSTQGINPYSYVANNPLNRTDPTGECANLIACSHFNSAGQGSWMGPKEVHGAVNKAEKHGLSKSVGGLLEKVYHGGAHLSSIAVNATGNTNVNDGTSLGNKKPNAVGGVSAAKLAQLSACSGNPNCQGVGGYRRNYAGLDPGKFVDTGSGFMAALFTNSATHQNVLGYASTDPLSWGDDKNDLRQEFGYPSRQYQEAVNLAVWVRGAVGKNLVLTGFSLGGGEASAGALKIGAHAATFDAPGLSSYTIRRYRLDLSRANELITAYHTTLDPLTWLQRLTPLPDAVGRPVTLPGLHFHSNSGVCESLGVSC